jgi:hypothetical protein
MEEVIRESFRRVEREGGALAQHFDEENNEKFGEPSP